MEAQQSHLDSPALLLTTLPVAQQHAQTEASALHVGLRMVLTFHREQDRLDWMYQGSMMAKAEASQRQEEAMLEGKPVQLDADGGPSKVRGCPWGFPASALLLRLHKSCQRRPVQG